MPTLTSRAGRWILALSCLCATALSAGAAAEDWTRFRGPNGSGISTSGRLPLTFGPEENVIWKRELPFGHSSPIESKGMSSTCR